MIRVLVSINGRIIHKRTAVRIEDEDKDGVAQYRTGNNTVIAHKPKDGAIELAIKMLKTLEK